MIVKGHISAYLWQIYEELLRFADHRRRAAHLTTGSYQFNRIDQFTTAIALVAPGVFISATRERTSAFDETVSQVTITFLAKQLLNGLNVQQALTIQFIKEFLHDSVNGI